MESQTTPLSIPEVAIMITKFLPLRSRSRLARVSHYFNSLLRDEIATKRKKKPYVHIHKNQNGKWIGDLRLIDGFPPKTKFIHQVPFSMKMFGNLIFGEISNIYIDLRRKTIPLILVYEGGIKVNLMLGEGLSFCVPIVEVVTKRKKILFSDCPIKLMELPSITRSEIELIISQ